MNDFLTVKELSKWLKISESTIYKLTFKKAIPFYRPSGGKILFAREEIIEWIKKNRTRNNVF